MKTIKATYTNGVLRPDEPLGLAEGAHVRLSVHDGEDEDLDRYLSAKFPNSYGAMPEADAEELGRIVEAEFGSVDPNDWK